MKAADLQGEWKIYEPHKDVLQRKIYIPGKFDVLFNIQPMFLNARNKFLARLKREYKAFSIIEIRSITISPSNNSTIMGLTTYVGVKYVARFNNAEQATLFKLTYG